MRSILVVGAGQSGLQLALTLLAEGYDVTLASARTADEIRAGAVTSTQAIFARALALERAYGLNLWDGQGGFDGLHVSVSDPPGRRALRFVAPLDEPGQSVDQRMKMATWLELYEDRGGTVRYGAVTAADLDRYTGRYDLVVVASGKSDLARLFPRDAARSPYSTPQRELSLAYVHGVEPDPLYPAAHVSFNAVPGVGEVVVVPGVTFTGPCDMLLVEAVPGGPLDRFGGSPPPGEVLARTLHLAREFAPWVYERCTSAELTDARGTLTGRFAPTVREGVATLPSGGSVLGMADVVVTNDPITGQGSNAAVRCAASYAEAILDRGGRPFDRAWMAATFERFWEVAGRPATEWTNLMLAPPAHVLRIFGAATGSDAVARRFAEGFSDPADLDDWLMSPAKTDAYLAAVTSGGR